MGNSGSQKQKVAEEEEKCPEISLEEKQKLEEGIHKLVQWDEKTTKLKEEMKSYESQIEGMPGSLYFDSVKTVVDVTTNSKIHALEGLQECVTPSVAAYKQFERLLDDKKIGKYYPELVDAAREIHHRYWSLLVDTSEKVNICNNNITCCNYCINTYNKYKDKTGMPPTQHINRCMTSFKKWSDACDCLEKLSNDFIQLVKDCDKHKCEVEMVSKMLETGFKKKKRALMVNAAVAGIATAVCVIVPPVGFAVGAGIGYKQYKEYKKMKQAKEMANGVCKDVKYIYDNLKHIGASSIRIHQDLNQMKHIVDIEESNMEVVKEFAEMLRDFQDKDLIDTITEQLNEIQQKLIIFRKQCITLMDHHILESQKAVVGLYQEYANK